MMCCAAVIFIKFIYMVMIFCFGHREGKPVHRFNVRIWFLADSKSIIAFIGVFQSYTYIQRCTQTAQHFWAFNRRLHQVPVY